ncbi:MAG: hypothetical protein Q4C20_11580 [Erysipelotrichaceae bacterium]|nr:hypothetical protein [Erysipelotrichaceae bacterium]
MKKEFQAAYVPIGVGTFHMESAQALFDTSKELLKKHLDNVIVPEKMILNIDALSEYLDTIDPDLIILQNLTFANAAYTAEIMHRFRDVPLLLWTLREPVIDGTRLRLNALTGAFSAANTIRQFKKEPFEFVYGSPDEAAVEETVKKMIAAARVHFEMKSLKMAAIGHTPQGFGFGRALDNDLLEVFGVHQEAIEARELIDAAKAFSDEECEEYLKDAENRTVGLSETPEKNRLDFARLYKAYDEYVKKNQIGAIASRCWPDFFTAFGTPVCAVLGILNDLGVVAACESDMYGALSMWIGMRLSEKSVFFGDPVSLDEKKNTITFWHCGMAACSLARKDTGAVIGEHCNRHIGPTMEFGCEASEHACVFRIGRNPDGTFRFFIAEGKAIDAPKQFFGTSTVIEMDFDAEMIVRESVISGWEPHYAVIYADVADELEMLARMFNAEVRRY